MAKGKIIVMRLFGGLGNQPFQYAFLFALSRQGGKARLEASSYEHDDKRVCELHHFRVSLPIEGGPPPWAFRKSRIPACLRSLFAAPKYPHFREEKRHGFDPGLAAPPRRHTYFKGYFQTEQYFLHCREQLCREFRLKTPLTPENARILEDIRSCCSISLHIRRTDYLSNPYLSPPPLEYYLRSMAEIIVPLLFPDNEMPAGRLRHWAELWREADITSEHVCGMPREQRAYLEAALAGRWIYLRLLQCFWKFKTARRKMFRLRFSKNGIDTLQILGYTLYSAKKLPRSSL